MSLIRIINIYFPLYVVPLILFILGITFIGLPFFIEFPKPGELIEYRGHLNSYYLLRNNCDRVNVCIYTPIITLQEGMHIWTEALNKDTAGAYLTKSGITLRFYIDPHSQDYQK